MVIEEERESDGNGSGCGSCRMKNCGVGRGGSSCGRESVVIVEGVVEREGCHRMKGKGREGEVEGRGKGR